MTTQTFRQRRAVAAYTSIERTRRSELRVAEHEFRQPPRLSVVAPAPHPPKHFEDTRVGWVAFGIVALAVVATVTVRMLQIMAGQS